MPRRPDSCRIDLAEMFHRVQDEMLAHLAVGRMFEHASSNGAATERHWLDLFDRYLPKRYRATPAFVIDSTGRRSRQIDVAIFDNLYSPLLFPHSSGLHVPAESVYAVFEVKPTISRQWLRDAGEKAASVRALHRTSVPVIAGGSRRSSILPRPILAGLLATGSVWTAAAFSANLRRALADLPPSQRLDLGCSLQHGAFELSTARADAGGVRAVSKGTSGIAAVSNDASGIVAVSKSDESLIFFILRLLERLREMGTAPAADLMQYGRSLQSFRY